MCNLFLRIDGFEVALSAEGFVFMRFSKHDLLVTSYDAVANVGQCSATHADSVYFRDIISDGAQLWHWSKRLALEVEVQAGYDDSDTAIGQVGADIYNL